MVTSYCNKDYRFYQSFIAMKDDIYLGVFMLLIFLIAFIG